MAKIKKEELETLQKLQSIISRGKESIANFELQKHFALMEVARATVEMSNLNNTLVEKHGEDAVVNVKTGDITNKL